MSIEKYLSPFLLKEVEFKLSSGKVLKRGLLKLVNTKQFYIRLSLQSADKSLKLFEIPYPFSLESDKNSCTFNYTLSSLCYNKSDLFYKLKTGNKKNYSKLYDTCLYMTCVEKR